MKKRLTALTALICLSALTTSCVSSEKEKEEMVFELPKPKFTVCVQVACQDESLEFKLLSLRKRELRKIADVTVVDIEEKPDYIVSIVAIKNKAAGKEVGYSYSYSFLKKHYYSDEVSEAIKHFYENISADMTEEGQGKVWKLYVDALENSIRDYSEYLDGGIQTVPFDTIENVCRSEVASFNQNALEPLRKESRRTKKLYEDEGVKVVEE
jgi:hypothetical protein